MGAGDPERDPGGVSVDLKREAAEGFVRRSRIGVVGWASGWERGRESRTSGCPRCLEAAGRGFMVGLAMGSDARGSLLGGALSADCMRAVEVSMSVLAQAMDQLYSNTR